MTVNRQHLIVCRDALRKKLDELPTWGAAASSLWEELASVERSLRTPAPGQEPNWIDRASWIAGEMAAVATNRWASTRAARDEKGTSPGHTLWMLDQLVGRQVGSETKTCRWLGWVQSQFADFELLNLDQMKHLNLRSKTEAPLVETPKAAPAAAASELARTPFQAQCQSWLEEIVHDDPTDLAERRARFMEEALELVQSLDMSLNEVIQVAAYVFGRKPGEPAQEYGGMFTTAMVLVLAQYTGHDLMLCGQAELERCWDPAVIEKIRGKRSRRHGRGPLPGTSEPEADLVP